MEEATYQCSSGSRRHGRYPNHFPQPSCRNRRWHCLCNRLSSIVCTVMDQILRVACVANSIRTSYKRLERNIRHKLSERSLPIACQSRASFISMTGPTNRAQGSSYRKRIATSKVAPPQHSNEYAFASAQLVSFAISTMSMVLSRVASND